MGWALQGKAFSSSASTIFHEKTDPDPLELCQKRAGSAARSLLRRETGVRQPWACPSDWRLHCVTPCVMATAALHAAIYLLCQYFLGSPAEMKILFRFTIRGWSCIRSVKLFSAGLSFRRGNPSLERLTTSPGRLALVHPEAWPSACQLAAFYVHMLLMLSVTKNFKHRCIIKQ